MRPKTRCFGLLLLLQWARPAGADCGQTGNLLPNCGFDVDESGWSFVADAVVGETVECATGPRCLELDRDSELGRTEATSACVQIAPSTYLTFGLSSRTVAGSTSRTCGVELAEYSDTACGAAVAGPSSEVGIDAAWRERRAGRAVSASTQSVALRYACVDVFADFSVGVDDFFVAPAIFTDGFEAYRTRDWSNAVGEVCVPSAEVCGDGFDQDCDLADATCPANDDPADAQELTASGTFTVDLRAARNDQDFAGTACGSAGGRDVFYEFTLPQAEVVYLDTFGSDFDTTLRLFAGSCAALGALQQCFDDQCSSLRTQGALGLAGGSYCLVADQFSSAQTQGSLVLAFVRGGRTGTALTASPVSGDSCSGTNATTGSCQSNSTAQDRAYYFTVCPSQTRTLSANTCTGTSFDSVLYLRKAGAAGEIACNDDFFSCGSGTQSSFTGASAVGPGLFWLTVDGYQTACGPFTLTHTLN